MEELRLRLEAAHPEEAPIRYRVADFNTAQDCHFTQPKKLWKNWLKNEERKS